MVIGKKKNAEKYKYKLREEFFFFFFFCSAYYVSNVEGKSTTSGCPSSILFFLKLFVRFFFVFQSLTDVRLYGNAGWSLSVSYLNGKQQGEYICLTS